MEVDVLWAKAVVFVLMASFIYGFVRPEFLGIGHPDSWLEMVWDGILAGLVMTTAVTVVMVIVFLGVQGVRFLLS